MSRVRHEHQLLQQEVTDLNARAEQIKVAHIDALKEADARARHLEINRLGRKLAIRELSNTPMSAMTKSLPGAGPTDRRGVANDD